MKIAIDGYEANVLQRVGSSQVAYELIKHFEKLDQDNEYTVVLPAEPLDDLPKSRDGFKYKILRPKKLWTQIALPLYLFSSKTKPDIFFSPTHYIPRFSPAKRVVTIFDLSFLHFPQMFNKNDLWKLSNWTKFSAKNADHIITISNFSKADIIQEYEIDKDKITVAYPGFSEEIFKPITDEKKIKEVLGKYGINDSYIIYIGTVQPRKNLIRLMEAVARVENINLIIAGKTSDGWMYEETLVTPKKLGIENRVKFLGFVPSLDLPYLLSGSKALVQPSLWEGFGLPVVEAMACEVPVLVSNVSSLPEVVGKAGLTFDPYSQDQIEQAIRTIITDKKLKVKHAKAGLERVKNFSYEKMARGILKSFSQLV